MKKLTSILVLCFALCFGLAFTVESNAQNSSSFNDFWAKFKASVMKDDKVSLSGMVKYPLAMPYGWKSIKNKTDFTKRYRDVFYKQLEGFPINSAKKCFADAMPEKDGNTYNVACNEVVIYSFVKSSGTWKLSGVDNINE